ncbi:MAG: SDR family NAD(P)-dependent oxidoreductase, partial [Acidobacteriaceae bacterium]|nr:SDR family NAD(P)-dependent oxidoreductase [Acidobacteriaceae bacterium]
GLTLNGNTVFLVTGAAGSIVSAITADLATASGGIFYLLDIVPEPDSNDPDLKKFSTDKDGLKRDIFARIQARGERATPALVEKALAGLERSQAAASAIEAVRAAGGTAQYCSVNLLDGDAVAKIIEHVRERHGRIDVLLHAAGMERSHLLPEKDAREFDLIFDVKADGFFHLLRAIDTLPVAATVAFSSIAGRFGNAGQADYSSANDLLCKITSSFRTTHPATRGIAIDWTAWGGIGMASRGSIPKMMELAGIDMLPVDAGVPLIRRELVSGGTRGEIVIGERLGILMNEWDSTGGLDLSAANSARGKNTRGAMVGEIKSVGLYSGITIDTTLDPSVQPFLYDHKIDGTPVLPGVMGIEAFAEAAAQLCPGWRVDAVEEVNFLAPFKFYRNEPRTVTIEAKVYTQHDALLADCRLIGKRQIPTHKDPQVTTHFTGRVRMTQQALERVTRPAPEKPGEAIIDKADIYRVYFHGPAYQVVQRGWLDGKHVVTEFTDNLPTNHEPAERPTLIVPRLIELCFQTAGLWELGVEGRFGLPLYIREVCLRRVPDGNEKLYAVATADPEHGAFNAEVLDSAGVQYLRVTGYRTVALGDAANPDALKALQHALTLQPV